MEGIMTIGPEKTGLGKNLTIYTVSELAGTIRQGLDRVFPGLLLIEGELSNVKLSQPAGHYYFTLKDAGASLRGVMFRGMARTLTFVPVDGLKVLLRGRISYYEPRGEIQVVAESMEPAGLGMFHLEFRRVREILEREGLLTPERKRAIPLMPRAVALITSTQGAAIWDFLRICDQQNRLVPIVVIPARMQGSEAVPEIIKALSLAAGRPGVDVTVIARGGGSAEDLWIFNREDLARAILASPVPVVTAIGHEVDLTVADLVADLRVATPTEAAKRVLFDGQSLLGALEGARHRLGGLLSIRQERESARLLSFRVSVATFSRRLSHWHLGVVRAQDRLSSGMKDGLSRKKAHLAVSISEIVHPYRRLSGLSRDLSSARERMIRKIRDLLGEFRLKHSLWDRRLCRENMIDFASLRLELRQRKFYLVSGIRQIKGRFAERQSLLSVLLRESDPRRPLSKGFFLLERDRGLGLVTLKNLPSQGEKIRARTQGLSIGMRVEEWHFDMEQEDGTKEG